MKCFAWLFIYTSQLSPPRQPHVSEPKTILMPPLPPTSGAASATGALPPEKLEDIFTPAPASAAPAQAPQSNDPAQFKIPGQN